MVRSLTVVFVIVLAAVAAAVCPVAHAQTAGTVPSAQEAAIEASIKELSTQWATAILKKDAAILERIWAPDFVDVAASGERFSKADGIAALKSGKGQPTRSELSSIDVRVYGGGTVAVDIGDYHEAGNDGDGKSYDRRSRFTNVWVLMDGSWRCVSAHASVLEPTR
jgi:ketosteroid isomerase-like protein